MPILFLKKAFKLKILAPIFLGGITIATLLSLLAKVHWFFSLFEHFRFIYLLFFIFFIPTTIYFKQYKQSILAIGIILINLFFIIRPSEQGLTKTLSPQHKIFIHNTYFKNEEYPQFENDIKSLNPDIIALIEVNKSALKKLNAAFSDYPYRFVSNYIDCLDYVIFSKKKFEIINEYQSEGIKSFLNFKIDQDSFYLVHVATPTNRQLSLNQQKAFHALESKIKNEKGFWMAFGDFNSTPWSQLNRSFLKEVIYFFSWKQAFPQGSWPSFLPSIFKIPIDHVYSNYPFQFNYGKTFNSDHRSMLIHPPSSRP